MIDSSFYLMLVRIAAGIALGLGLWTCDSLRPEETAQSHATLHFFDIGQGDAALIRTPNGKAYLIDVGNEPEALLCHLKRLEIHELEAVFISHAHRDHYGALAPLASALPLRKVYLPLTRDPDSTWYRTLDTPDLRKIPRDTLVRGEVLDLHPELKLTCLWPTPAANQLEPPLGENDLSTVLRLDMGESCALFTGDIEAESERRLLQLSPDLDCDILKIAHHGSKTSSELPFLAAVSPSRAVISAKHAVYGHPHPETLEALNRYHLDGERIYLTEEHGSIVFHLGRDGIQKEETLEACAPH